MKYTNTIFKGKNMQGKWIEGFLVYIKLGEYTPMLYPIELSKKGIATDCMIDNEETLSQYTGKDDKFGNKIFVGAALTDKENHTYRIQVDPNNGIITLSSSDYKMVYNKPIISFDKELWDKQEFRIIEDIDGTKFDEHGKPIGGTQEEKKDENPDKEQKDTDDDNDNSNNNEE